MAIDVTPVPLAYHYRASRKPMKLGKGGGGGISSKLKSGGTSGDGAALASRQVIDPELVGLGAENVPGAMITETQAPIMERKGRAIFTPGSLMDIATSGRSNRANPAYDASKAIGGDNVPYQPASGVGGWFRRAFMGDSSNTDNIAAQQAQGQAWAGEKAAKDARTEQLGMEDRQFGRQKELFGMQAGENAKRDEATQARQDARDAVAEANRMAERDEDAIRDELKSGEAEDRFNRTLEATKASKPPTAYDPDKVYQNDDGSLYGFKRDPMTGKIVKADITDKPAFTPPPKGSVPDGPAKAPLALGEEIPGIVSPEILQSVRRLGSGIKRNITETPAQLSNDLGAAVFGGRVSANPTTLTKGLLGTAAMSQRPLEAVKALSPTLLKKILFPTLYPTVQ